MRRVGLLPSRCRRVRPGEHAREGGHLLAERRGQGGERGAGGDDGDLLAHHGPDEHLVRIGGPRNADARQTRDERSELRMPRQRVVDGDRVGVEVEQTPGARDEGRQIGEVRQCRAQAHTAEVVEAELEPCRPVGKTERAGERRVGGGLGARHGAGAHPGEEPRGIERAAVRECQVDRDVGRAQRGCSGLPFAGPRQPAPSAELERRHPEDLTDGVVELAHAREARREGDVGGRQVGAHEQHAGRLRPVRTAECQRSGAELGGEEPRQVPRGVAEPSREPGDALALDDTVGDEAHGAAGGVAPEIPLGRARRSFRQAALARAVARLVGGGARRIEGHVRRLGSAGRAARPAVDARGAHRRDELAVEARIARVDRAVALVE